MPDEAHRLRNREQGTRWRSRLAGKELGRSSCALLSGFAIGFGVTEAARQNGGKKATKTWIVTSSNPRESHAAMDGETVPIDGTFSNGLDWPASCGDPDEVAGCQCEVSVSW